MQLWFIFSLILAIFVTVFAIMNASPVQIKLIFYEFELSQALVIFISAALGAIIVTFLGLVKQIKSSIKIKDLTRQVNQLSDEYDTLTQENHRLAEKIAQLENTSIPIADRNAPDLDDITDEESHYDNNTTSSS